MLYVLYGTYGRFEILVLVERRNFLKFIFPQNYNFKNKLFGVIDYTTIVVNIVWSTFVFLIVFLIFLLVLNQMFLLLFQ